MTEQRVDVFEVPICVMDPEAMLMPSGTRHTFKFENPAALRIYFEKTGLNDTPFALFVMEDPSRQGHDLPDNFYKIGVVASVVVNYDLLQVQFEGLYRAEVVNIRSKQNGVYRYFVARVSQVKDDMCDTYLFEHQEELKTDFATIVSLASKFAVEANGIFPHYNHYTLVDQARQLREVNTFDQDAIEDRVWVVAFQIPRISAEERQSFISCTSLPERVKLLIKVLGLNIKAMSGAREVYRRGTLPAFRRQRRKVVQSQDNRSSDEENLANMTPEMIERWKKYQEIKDSLTPDQDKAIMEDFGRLNSCYPGQAEYNTFINHLDTLLTLYSSAPTPQETDISKVEEKLGKSHHDLEDVKDKIYDYLATKIRNPKGKAPILCFVGPPGVGKTSIGESIAEALGLKFVRLSLGGVRDEADIRGHRLTYIGAISGKIIQEIVRLGVKNPVFMLDEVDKVNNDFRGDPSSALLEVLDPEQNYSFQDHYIGAPFDLSGVLFLCTANLESGIQPALRDRMDVISISGYTENEKVQIAKEFLVPKQIVETGISGVEISWQDDNPDSILSKVVSAYTREAGVRQLERQIHQLFSRWGRCSMKGNQGKLAKQLIITEKLVEELLGLPKQTHERVNITEVGEAIGLAWTPVGGDIMYVQAQLTPHGRTEKDISQTGNLGKIFEEANKNAFTVVKNRLRDDKKAMQRLIDDLLCVSVPEGAIPKDGPSAGVPMALAMYSRLIGKPLKPYVAMSGELDILERIHAVGGIKEKVLAAHRDGVKEVILPVKNRENVKKDVLDEIKRELKFHFVTRIEEVLPIVFPDDASNTR